MRTAFISALLEEARKDPSIMLLTGDLGFNVLEEFAEELPEQFLNCGVAEQSMAGIAAGLAASGRKVFIYSIANFPTFRCLEQIRNDIAYHNLNVTIVSVGAGFAYGHLGYSHLGLEDLSIMRSIPGIDLLCPADPLEASLLTKALLNKSGPAYLRLGKAGEEVFHGIPPDIRWGEAIEARTGSHLTIAAIGSVLGLALKAYDELQKVGIDVTVFSIPFLRPLSIKCVEAAIGNGLVTVEEHSIIGGLGSAVLDAVVENNGIPNLRKIGAPCALPKAIGDINFMRKESGITTDLIVEAVQSLLIRSTPQKGS
jgi:transketolase